MPEILWRGFQDGVNTRDASSELGEHELVDASNVTINERGSLEKRLGYSDRHGQAIGSGLVSNLFYWSAVNKVVAQIGVGIHVDGAASIKNFSTSERVGFAEFAGSLYIIHPTDKLFKVTAGMVVSGPIANSPKGNCLAVWQNKLFAGGDPDNKPRVAWSNAGNADAWTATDFVDLREKDSEIVTALGGASGVDISGRPGLLAFKEASTYRINNSATGTYSTIDSEVGASSNIAIANAHGRTYVINSKGIFSTEGNGAHREESERIENLFSEAQINQSRGDLYCAGRFQDRLYFSLPRAGQTANNLELEFHPRQKWIMPHSKAASCYAYFGKGISTLIFGSPSSAGRIYNSHRTGADAGTAISCYAQLRWTEPNAGNLTRIRRARFMGMGAFTADIYRDYELSTSMASLSINISSVAAEYDDPNSLYDTDDYYGSLHEQRHDERWSVGVVRSVSVKIVESSSLSFQGRPIAGGASQPEQGAWILSGVRMTVLPLGAL
jgi:hypothetical protein